MNLVPSRWWVVRGRWYCCSVAINVSPPKIVRATRQQPRPPADPAAARHSTLRALLRSPSTHFPPLDSVRPTDHGGYRRVKGNLEAARRGTRGGTRKGAMGKRMPSALGMAKTRARWCAAPCAPKQEGGGRAGCNQRSAANVQAEFTSAEEAASKKASRSFKKYSYRGVELDQLLDLSNEAFIEVS